MSNIMMYRLVTGEFVVADVSDSDISDTVNMTNPIVLVPSQQGIGMSPMLAYAASDSVEISRDHILFETKPSSDIESEFRRIFSGIIVQSSSLIN